MHNQFILIHLEPHQSYGIGRQPAATHPIIHTPKLALHPTIATGTPAPAVTVPNTSPALA